MRRLVLSDFHFGDDGAMGAHPLVLDRLAGELDWAQELVIDGDLFSFFSASMTDAVHAARPFLALVAAHVGKVIYLPGNHDHHLVAVAADERELSMVTGARHRVVSAVAPARRLLQALMPGVEVAAEYPSARLDDVTYMHGHHISAHMHDSRLPPLDWHRWRQTARGERRFDPMHPEDYEGLLAPLYEAAYHSGHPSSPEARLASRTLLDDSRMALNAPRPRYRPVTPRAGRRASEALRLTRRLKPRDWFLTALARVCEDWQVPEGLVVYGHTHQFHGPLAAPGDGRWQFANCGSWMFDRYMLHLARSEDWAHPGTCLRVDGDRVQARELLSDIPVERLHTLTARG